MEKKIQNLIVKESLRLSATYGLLKLRALEGETLPEMLPGQFVQVEVADAKNTFLRRPISVNFVDRENQELWLLIRNAGEGTAHLIALEAGDQLNVILPLGRGFSMPGDKSKRLLLAGGGVGVAPMLYFGSELKKAGYNVHFLLGARKKEDLLELDEFARYGELYISTEDGSMGEKGLITQNTALQRTWDNIYCCGPMPMMKAVAAYAMRNNIECEVSLENKMACGIGACLCCVEDTTRGNTCVCTEGPVFNIKELKWGI